MKKDIKEYGTDLLKQFNELEQSQTTLRNKVAKRFCYLLKHSDDPYLEGFDCAATGSYSVDMMIFVIMRVEKNYVNKSRQTELFDDVEPKQDIND